MQSRNKTPSASVFTTRTAPPLFRECSASVPLYNSSFTCGSISEGSDSEPTSRFAFLLVPGGASSSIMVMKSCTMSAAAMPVISAVHRDIRDGCQFEAVTRVRDSERRTHRGRSSERLRRRQLHYHAGQTESNDEAREDFGRKLCGRTRS